MADFLNRYTTMNFRIGLLELEVYITADGDWIVVPYLTTKTQVVERLYVRVENADRSEAQLVEARPVEEKAPEAVTKKERKVYLSKNALSDEELYSLIEGQGKENLNTELREGIQGIIDDVRNNQLDGYSVKRTDRSFAIHLESTFLVRSSSVLVISVNEARFFKTVLQGTLLTSGLDPETADRLVDEYVSFLETALYARTGKCDVVISNLSLLASKRAELFAELQRLARAIDDAMRRV